MMFAIASEAAVFGYTDSTQMSAAAPTPAGNSLRHESQPNIGHQSFTFVDIEFRVTKLN